MPTLYKSIYLSVCRRLGTLWRQEHLFVFVRFHSSQVSQWSSAAANTLSVSVEHEVTRNNASLLCLHF